MFFFGIASVSGGLAAGIFWTAQGGYLARAATAIAATEQTSQHSITIELASRFAFDLLLFENISRILYSYLLSRSFSAGQIGCMYTIVALASTFTMVRAGGDIECEPKDACTPRGSSFRAFRLWTDPRLWLLSFANITFGISVAYLNGYFNATHAKPELGVDKIGYLTAFGVFTSMCLTPCYGFLGRRFGNGAPMLCGSASFACMSLVLLLSSCCSDWGMRLLLFYALQGSGRAVFESTNKATFCNTFKGVDSEGAFANIVLQQSLAAAMCFFMSASLSGHALEIMMLVFALLTPLGYKAKTYLDTLHASEASPLMTEDKRSA
jgi:hypothetical protein